MCHCKQYGEYVEIWFDSAPSFELAFTTIARGTDVELRRCDECGAYWQIDVGRGGLAIRIHDPANWREFDDRPVRLQHMIAYHGGYGEGRCGWTGCDRQPLKGMKLCPHHAYPMLSAEEDNKKGTLGQS
jgi:hypothetical protein